MLKQFYDFEHGIHFHFYDIPTIVIAVIIVVMLIVHIIRAKRRKDHYEDELQQRIDEANERNAEIENAAENKEGV